MHEVKMFYVRLTWCYGDILNPSIKTKLTCLTCLLHWLVVIHACGNAFCYYKLSSFTI